MTDDITYRKHGGNEFSNAANQSTDKDRDLQRIYRLLHSIYPNGLTADEVAARFGMLSQTCSARFSEMKYYGWLEKCGVRNTRSGRPAGVWRITKEDEE